MNRRRRIVAVAVNTLILGLLLAGCGNYDPKPGTSVGGSPGAGGDTAAGGDSETAGQTALGGSSSGGASSGGASSGGASSGGSSAGGDTGAAGAATCENVTPCGGDVLGTWTVASSCLTVSGNVDMSSFGLGCTEATVSGSLDVTGTFTANGDGSFTDETTTTGVEQLEIPAACLNISGTITTCDRVGPPMVSLGYSDVSCVNNDATDGCTCSATVNQTGGMGAVSLSAASSGTYSTADNVLTISDSGTETPYAYCVSDATLTMVPQITEPGAVAGSVVLQKQ